MKIFKHQGPALLWALFILIICNANLGKAGDSPMFFKGFDKLTHCGLFFVQAVLINQGLVRKYLQEFSYAMALKTLLICVIYGALIEVLQLYIFTWRNGEWADLFCDTLGAAMATFCILVSLKAAKYAKI